MKKNLLVTLADKNYIDQAKQLFSSVYWNAGWDGDYMLLAYKIPEKDLKWFREKGIFIKKCRSIYSKEKIKRLYEESSADRNRFSLNYFTIILCKFYLFTTYFKKWKNIVYLDSDIVVRASLNELTKVNGFGAVVDLSKKLKEQFGGCDKHRTIFTKLKRNYNLKEKSFNCGVIAFNTKIIKGDTISKLKNLLGDYNKINSFNEQSTLNLFFYKKWKKLPRIYNLFPYALIDGYLVKPEKVNGIILHFQEFKPWRVRDFFYEEWGKNLEKSELINLKELQIPNRWDNKKIKEHSSYFRRKIPIFLLCRCLGLFGIFLKNNFPGVYFKLKRIKNHKN